MARRLLVLRHAETRSAPPGGSDADRELTGAGRRAAATLARPVAAHRLDLVLCSSALRARQTLDALDLPADVPVSIEPALYGADADELLEHLRELDSDVTTALLIGHNPAVHHLVLELTAGERVPGFAPATLAVLDLDVDGWAESASGTGRLLSLHIPDEQAR